MLSHLEIRATQRPHATLDAVGEEPEIYVVNFSDAPGAARVTGGPDNVSKGYIVYVNGIREARERAGLTQEELAEASGVARPNIAAYESGSRRPSPAMLQRLLDAAKPRPSSALAAHRDEIRGLAHDFGVKNPRVFGSVARGDDLPGSDLDLLVTVPRGKGLLALVGFAHAVEDLLGVHVDVVSEGGLGERHAYIGCNAVPV